jgi:hypothetical protein
VLTLVLQLLGVNDMVTIGNKIMHKVTKRLAATPILVHVPDWAVKSITINSERPDVLHVIAEDISKSSQPDIFPMEKWEVEEPTERVRESLFYAGWSDYCSRVLTDEAFRDFVVSKLNVSAFVRKYGIFKWDPPDTLDGPNPKEDPRIRKFRVYESEYKREQDYMWGLLALHGQIRSGDRGKARELAAGLELPYADDPEKALSFAISAKLNRGSISFSFENLNQAVLKCGDVLTGLHAYLWGTYVTKYYWSACPNCGVVFQASEKKIFHDIRCGRIYKQRRWRKNQKEKKDLQTSRKGKKRRIS